MTAIIKHNVWCQSMQIQYPPRKSNPGQIQSANESNPTLADLIRAVLWVTDVPLLPKLEQEPN